MGGLTLPSWRAAFKELYRILVPGGWINLIEPLMDVGQFSWTPGPATTQFFMLVRAVMLANGIIPDLPHRLPALLQEAGFINIHTKECEVSLYGHDGAEMRDNIRTGMLGLRAPVLDAGGMGFVKNEEEYNGWLTATMEELSETPESVSQNFMVYAQKPASA
jgi:hypothetical protein